MPIASVTTSVVAPLRRQAKKLGEINSPGGAYRVPTGIGPSPVRPYPPGAPRVFT